MTTTIWTRNIVTHRLKISVKVCYMTEAKRRKTLSPFHQGMKSIVKETLATTRDQSKLHAVHQY